MITCLLIGWKRSYLSSDWLKGSYLSSIGWKWFYLLLIGWKWSYLSSDWLKISPPIIWLVEKDPTCLLIGWKGSYLPSDWLKRILPVFDWLKLILPVFWLLENDPTCLRLVKIDFTCLLIGWKYPHLSSD